MALQFKTETDYVQERFEDLLRSCNRCDSQEDRELIEKAFRVANDAHKGAKRKSGEPYIIHPIAVAKIVTYEIGLGAKSVASALLHDVVEDTDYTIEDMENLFGKKIASIIEGLTKISGVFGKNTSLQAENFRKILLTLSEDVRVIIIKLADRLHNMRTLEALPYQKRMKIAGETIYLFAPLAHRLGLYQIKTELEDLSLKHRHPKVYEEISKQIRGTERKRQAFINKFSMPIIDRLVSSGVKFEINGRPKSIYSIWNKMQTKNIPFEDVYDLLAIRIVFEPVPDIPEKTQCWNIYSMVTDIYMPKPERIRDWVSTPKANGYEALHTTVMGPEGNWVEVQIRSKRMDEIAERGFAAHWKYKNTGSSGGELDKWLKKIRELLENPSTDALEFLDEFKMNLFSSEIMVFTPRGHIKTLPKDSTALDFAYEIHSQVGNKAIGAKINHRLVPLSHKIKGGDQVEIITSDQARPQKEWFSIVKTAKAKAALKTALKAETKNRIEKGKAILEEKLAELKLKPSSRIFKKLIPGYEVNTKDELYSKIGANIIALDNLKKILKKNTKNKWIRYWEIQFSRSSSRSKKPQKTSGTNSGSIKDGPVIIDENIDEASFSYEVGKCCNPIPGDEIIGYKNTGNSLVIHKVRCPNAVRFMSSQAERVIPIKWAVQKLFSFLVKIKISGFDKFGVYNQITTVVSKELNVNMRTINLSSHDGIFDGFIEIYVHDTKDLNNLIMNLMKIKGVDAVSRAETVEE